MTNLAATYGALGRHQDSLVLLEKVLAFRQRVLPQNHPEIGAASLRLLISRLTSLVLGTSMSALAIAYSALGRHQDALLLKEKTLEFRRRVLPENHPDIGATRLCWLIFTFGLTRSRRRNEQSCHHVQGTRAAPRSPGVSREDP